MATTRIAFYFQLEAKTGKILQEPTAAVRTIQKDVFPIVQPYAKGGISRQLDEIANKPPATKTRQRSLTPSTPSPSTETSPAHKRQTRQWQSGNPVPMPNLENMINQSLVRPTVVNPPLSPATIREDAEARVQLGFEAANVSAPIEVSSLVSSGSSDDLFSRSITSSSRSKTDAMM
ncbi:hypothetical protein FBU30_008711 [Linnemannia zychae]|nr:hypothetical protein FBU30_008711 [Linnemannia zychae]